MNKSDDISNVAVAIQRIQAKLPAVGKDSKGYGYEYASLPEVCNKVYPLMNEADLSVSQILDESMAGGPAMTTIIMHESGQWISGTYPLAEAGMKGVNSAQQFGAAITYARRYGLLAVLGIPVADDDAACLSEKPDNKSKPAGNKSKAKEPTVGELASALNAATSMTEVKGVWAQVEKMSMSDDDRAYLTDLGSKAKKRIQETDAA